RRYVLVHRRRWLEDRRMADEAVRLSAGEELSVGAVHPRRTAFELRQCAVSRVPDAGGAGLLDAVHESERLDRIRACVHLLDTGPLGDGGLPGSDAGGRRRDRARQGRRGHDAHGGARRVLRWLHDELDRRSHRPIPRGANRPLDLQLVFLVRIVRCAGADRVRVQGCAVGERLPLSRPLADGLRDQDAHPDAHRAFRRRQARADNRRRAALHVAAQTRDPVGIRALSALLPRVVAHRTAVAARRPAGADPDLVRALDRHGRSSARLDDESALTLRRSIVLALAAVLLAVPAAAQQRRARRPAPPPAPAPAPAARRPIAAAVIPTPRSVLGFEPGDDRKLVEWPVLVRYFEALAKASDRVDYRELGKTTLGAPFIALVISSPQNLKRLDYYRQLNANLADPRTFRTSRAARDALQAGKTIVLITS